MKSSSSNSILRQDCLCLSRCHPFLPSSYYFYITYADLLISYLVSTPVDPFIPFSIHSPSFHSIQLKSFACKSRCRQISRNASIPVNWSRSGAITCTFHPTLSLFLFFAPFSYPSDTRRLSAQEKGFRIPQTTRSPTVLSVASSFPSSPAAKPRLSAKLSPDSPFHPSFPTHETPDELWNWIPLPTCRWNRVVGDLDKGASP